MLVDAIKEYNYVHFYYLIFLNFMKSLFLVRRYFASILLLYLDIKYTKSHEWVQYFPETKLARVGISNFAQEQLGEIVHVELPAIGKKVAELESTVVIESVKIAADVYTPVAG